MQTGFTMYTAASDQKIEIEASSDIKTVLINCEKVEMDVSELKVFLVQLALAQSLIKGPSEQDFYNDDTVFIPPDAL